MLSSSQLGAVPRVWLLMNTLRSIIFRWSARRKWVKYCAGYTSVDAPELSQLNASTYPGLRGCFSVQETDCWRLIALWASNTDFRASQSKFEKILDVANPCVGDTFEVAAPKPPWWKRLPQLSDALIKLFAVFGVFAAWQSYYGSILARPDVLTPGLSASYDQLKGQKFNITFNLRNGAASGPCTVEISPPQVQGANGANNGITIISPSSDRMPIASGNEQPITVAGDAITPGFYSIQVPIAARMGALRSKAIVPCNFVLHVLDDVEIQGHQPIGNIGASMLMYGESWVTECEIGAQSIDGEAILDNVAGIRVTKITAATLTSRQTDSDHTGNVSKVSWTFGPCPAKTKIRFALMLESDKPVSADQWEAAAKAVQVHFQAHAKE